MVNISGLRQVNVIFAGKVNKNDTNKVSFLPIIFKILSSFKNIKHVIPDISGYYVKFGTQSDDECNTRVLKEHCGWHGFYLNIVIKMSPNNLSGDNECWALICILIN